MSVWLTRARSSALIVIVTNAGSLVSTSLVTAALGAVYWSVAARDFTPSDVGLASAAVSATGLLGAASLMGTGTLLIGELPSRGTHARIQLVATATALSAMVGLVLGAVFAVVAPVLSPDFASFGSPLVLLALSAGAVSLSAATGVMDHAFVGLLRGGVQTVRNVVFAVVKLVALWIAASYLGDHGVAAIYATWPIGIVVSLAAVAGASGLGRFPLRVYRPDLGLLRELGRLSALHHILNIASQTPSLVLPFIVTALLSASNNAYFYIAFMLASFIYMIPNALSTALYAVGSHAPVRFANTLRLTSGLSLLGAICANVVFAVAAIPILNLVNREYAATVPPLLYVLALGAFPMIVRTHYVAVCQAHRRLRGAIVMIGLTGLVELGGAVLGARQAGLKGVAIGWVCALVVEAVVMGPTVIRAALPGVSPGASK